MQKASGPDLISPYILKHCANEIAPILQVNPHPPVHCHMTSCQLTSAQCSKRETVVVLVITDLYFYFYMCQDHHVEHIKLPFNYGPS